MNHANSRLTAARTLFLVFISVLTAGTGDASAQLRRRSVEPPPIAEPLPEIGGEGARCSYAYHDALAKIGNGRARQLVTFESEARIPEPGLTGKWLFWIKAGRGAKAPTSEQVCAEQVVRNGRQRCMRWETKPIDAAIVGAQPTADELGLLRSLDSFVVDKGAALEFGPNGRQFVTLQRVAGEIGNYSSQPRHPALCNGVVEMMDFHTNTLAGLKKRGEDVSALTAKAIALARLRVIAARDQRKAEARAQMAAVSVGVGAAEPDATSKLAARPISLPDLPQIPPDANPTRLVVLALEGLVAAEPLKSLEAEPSAYRRLQRARELIGAEALADATPAARAAAGAALRMVEAAYYADALSARMKHFQGLFFGTIEQIREAHRENCTCGN